MSKESHNPKVIKIILLTVLMMGILWIGKEYLPSKESWKEVEQKPENNLQEEVTYIIDKGEENGISYQISISENSTVFSLLEELAERESFDIESTVYPEMGVLVDSINGYKNGIDDKYWQYWVNGDLPMVAADKKEVEGGDKIEWKFAPFPF